MTPSALLQPGGPVYTPHPQQVRFHADPRERRWYCAGYGSGKTTASVFEGFANAVIRHPGMVGIVAAPSFPLLFQAWFTEWCQWIPREWWTLHQDPKAGSELRVRTPDGQTSRILLRSTSNPVSNEGVNAAWLVFDEAPRERDRTAYDILVSRVRRGYPGRQRGVILTGPPMTRRHWTALEYGTGPDATHLGHVRHWTDGVQSVVRCRTRDNPFLPKGYEAQLRSRPGASKQWCDQFLDALFGAAEGQVFPAFSPDVHVIRAATLAARRWRRVGVGVDWGWAHPGVMLTGGQDGLGDIYILREDVHSQKVVADTPAGWGPVAKDISKRYSPELWACDPSQPGSIENLASWPGVRGLVYGANNDVQEGLNRVAARLEWAVTRPVKLGTGRPALYISDDCPYTIAEFQSYARRKERDGSLSEAPEKRGDDAMDALRYLVMALTDSG